MIKKHPKTNVHRIEDISLLYTGSSTVSDKNISTTKLTLEQDVSRELLSIFKKINKIRTHNEYIKKEKEKLEKPIIKQWSESIFTYFQSPTKFEINHKDMKNYLNKAARYHYNNVSDINTTQLHNIHRNIIDMNNNIKLLQYEIRNKRIIENKQYREYKDKGTPYGKFTESLNQYAEYEIKQNDDYIKIHRKGFIKKFFTTTVYPLIIPTLKGFLVTMSYPTAIQLAEHISNIYPIPQDILVHGFLAGMLFIVNTSENIVRYSYDDDATPHNWSSLFISGFVTSFFLDSFIYTGISKTLFLYGKMESYGNIIGWVNLRNVMMVPAAGLLYSSQIAIKGLGQSYKYDMYRKQIIDSYNYMKNDNENENLYVTYLHPENHIEERKHIIYAILNELKHFNPKHILLKLLNLVEEVEDLNHMWLDKFILKITIDPMVPIISLMLPATTLQTLIWLALRPLRSVNFLFRGVTDAVYSTTLMPLGKNLRDIVESLVYIPYIGPKLVLRGSIYALDILQSIGNTIVDRIPNVIKNNILVSAIITMVSASLYTYFQNYDLSHYEMGFRMLTYILSSWYCISAFGIKYGETLMGLLRSAALTFKLYEFVPNIILDYFISSSILPILKNHIYKFTAFAIPYIYIGLHDLSDLKEIGSLPLKLGTIFAVLEFITAKIPLPYLNNKGIFKFIFNQLFIYLEGVREYLFEDYKGTFAGLEEKYGTFEFVHTVIDENVFSRVMIDNYANSVLKNIKSKAIRHILFQSPEWMHSEETLKINDLKNVKNQIDNQLGKDKKIDNIIEENDIINIVSDNDIEDIEILLKDTLDSDEYDIIRKEFSENPNIFIKNHNMRKIKIEYYDEMSNKLSEIVDTDRETITVAELNDENIESAYDTIVDELGQSFIWWNTDRKVDIEEVKVLMEDYVNIYNSERESNFNDFQNINSDLENLSDEYELINKLIEKDVKLLNTPVGSQSKTELFNILKSENVLETDLNEKVKHFSIKLKYLKKNIQNSRTQDNSIFKINKILFEKILFPTKYKHFPMKEQHSILNKISSIKNHFEIPSDNKESLFQLLVNDDKIIDNSLFPNWSSLQNIYDKLKVSINSKSIPESYAQGLKDESDKDESDWVNNFFKDLQLNDINTVKHNTEYLKDRISELNRENIDHKKLFNEMIEQEKHIKKSEIDILRRNMLNDKSYAKLLEELWKGSYSKTPASAELLEYHHKYLDWIKEQIDHEVNKSRKIGEQYLEYKIQNSNGSTREFMNIHQYDPIIITQANIWIREIDRRKSPYLNKDIIEAGVKKIVTNNEINKKIKNSSISKSIKDLLYNQDMLEKMNIYKYREDENDFNTNLLYFKYFTNKNLITEHTVQLIEKLQNIIDEYKIKNGIQYMDTIQVLPYIFKQWENLVGRKWDIIGTNIIFFIIDNLYAIMRTVVDILPSIYPVFKNIDQWPILTQLIDILPSKDTIKQFFINMTRIPTFAGNALDSGWKTFLEVFSLNNILKQLGISYILKKLEISSIFVEEFDYWVKTNLYDLPRYLFKSLYQSIEIKYNIPREFPNKNIEFLGIECNFLNLFIKVGNAMRYGLSWWYDAVKITEIDEKVKNFLGISKMSLEKLKKNNLKLTQNFKTQLKDFKINYQNKDDYSNMKNQLISEYATKYKNNIIKHKTMLNMHSNSILDNIKTYKLYRKTKHSKSSLAETKIDIDNILETQLDTMTQLELKIDTEIDQLTQIETAFGFDDDDVILDELKDLNLGDKIPTSDDNQDDGLGNFLSSIELLGVSAIRHSGMEMNWANYLSYGMADEIKTFIGLAGQKRLNIQNIKNIFTESKDSRVNFILNKLKKRLLKGNIDDVVKKTIDEHIYILASIDKRTNKELLEIRVNTPTFMLDKFKNYIDEQPEHAVTQAASMASEFYEWSTGNLSFKSTILKYINNQKSGGETDENIYINIQTKFPTMFRDFKQKFSNHRFLKRMFDDVITWGNPAWLNLLHPGNNLNYNYNMMTVSKNLEKRFDNDLELEDYRQKIFANKNEIDSLVTNYNKKHQINLEGVPNYSKSTFEDFSTEYIKNKELYHKWNFYDYEVIQTIIKYAKYAKIPLRPVEWAAERFIHKPHQKNYALEHTTTSTLLKEDLSTEQFEYYKPIDQKSLHLRNFGVVNYHLIKDDIDKNIPKRENLATDKRDEEFLFSPHIYKAKVLYTDEPPTYVEKLFAYNNICVNNECQLTKYGLINIDQTNLTPKTKDFLNVYAKVFEGQQMYDSFHTRETIKNTGINLWLNRMLGGNSDDLGIFEPNEDDILGTFATFVGNNDILKYFFKKANKDKKLILSENHRKIFNKILEL